MTRQKLDQRPCLEPCITENGLFDKRLIKGDNLPGLRVAEVAVA